MNYMTRFKALKCRVVSQFEARNLLDLLPPGDLVQVIVCSKGGALDAASAIGKENKLKLGLSAAAPL